MIGRGRFLKCFQVTADALGGEPLTIKLTDRPRLMTRIAVHRGVCADQRKTILMFVDRLDQNLPAADAVAEVAFRAIFPPVNVGMTILAIAAQVSEYRVDVTFLACHAQVQAAQWITGFVVVEVRLRADRLPRRRRVTFLAGNLHRPMWTATRGRGCGLLPGRNTGGHLEQQERLN